MNNFFLDVESSEKKLFRESDRSTEDGGNISDWLDQCEKNQESNSLGDEEETEEEQEFEFDLPETDDGISLDENIVFEDEEEK